MTRLSRCVRGECPHSVVMAQEHVAVHTFPPYWGGKAGKISFFYNLHAPVRAFALAKQSNFFKIHI